MHKRSRLLLSFLCMLALLTACFPSQSMASDVAAPDAELKAAFESGSLVLRQIPLFPGPGPYTLHIPTKFFEEVMERDVDGKEAVYSEDRAYVTVELSVQEMEANMPTSCYFSPDGGKVLCMDGDKAYVVQGHDVTLIAFDTQRSVPDSYGSFERFSHAHPSQWVGSEGVAWSPDGRYAVLTNYKAVLILAQFFYGGLYIIDTMIGQLYCADTYPYKMQEHPGAVVQACFDATGRYIYYMLYGRVYDDSIFSLMRYDMQTGEKERLYACPTFSAYPKLQWTKQDQLVNLLDSRDAKEPLGLNVFEEKGGAWTSSSLPFSQPGGLLRPSCMETGAAGLGVLLHTMRTVDNAFYLPARFDMNMGFAGYDELLLISSFDAPSATKLTMADFKDPQLLVDKLAGSDVLICANIHVSPDGQYALMLMRNKKNEFGFLMMDLQTLALRRVQAPSGTASLYSGYNIAPSANYPAGYGWFAGNKLAIHTEEGLKLYEFAD